MKIVAVRIGKAYGPEYETYLESKLPQHEFIWVREPIQKNIKFQWNKMLGMNLDVDEPICVMDIDLLLINDYHDIFNYPIERGQFLAMPAWWNDTSNSNYSINGGFFKYYPKDCQYIYEKFMSNPEHWQRYYIDNGYTVGPVNGEQFFVEDSVKERLDLITFPASWCTRWDAEGDIEWQEDISNLYKEETGNDYLFMGEFHDDVKLVHFTHIANKPHEWKYYDACS